MYAMSYTDETGNLLYAEAGNVGFRRKIPTIYNYDYLAANDVHDISSNWHVCVRGQLA